MGGESELALYKKGEKVQVIPLPTSTSHPHAYVRAIHEDNKKRIWIGTWEAGLFYYEPEKENSPKSTKTTHSLWMCGVFMKNRMESYG